MKEKQREIVLFGHYIENWRFEENYTLDKPIKKENENTKYIYVAHLFYS